MFWNVKCCINASRFAENPHPLLEIERTYILKKYQGGSFSDKEVFLYGNYLKTFQCWSIGSIALGILDWFSQSWRDYYSRNLTLSFIEGLEKKESIIYDYHLTRSLLPFMHSEIQQDFFANLVQYDIEAKKLLLISKHTSLASAELSNIAALYSLWPDVDRVELIRNINRLAAKYHQLKNIPKEKLSLVTVSRYLWLKRSDDDTNAPGIKHVLPVTCKDLEYEIELRKTTYRTFNEDLQEYVINQPENIVYRFGSKEPISFYKVSKSRSLGSAIMERINWELASVLKLHNTFAPTQICSKKITKGKYNSGSLQIALKGKTLTEILLTNQVYLISQKELIKGFLTSLIFGFYDNASSNNIIVKESGEVGFFDNTRSLPRSNGVLVYVKDLSLSFFSSLLELPGAYTPLDFHDWSIIKDYMEQRGDILTKVENHLKSKTTQLKLEKVPYYWIYLEDSINALSERLERLDEAINNKSIKCLRDLLFFLHPELKFMTAISLTFARNAAIWNNIAIYWKILKTPEEQTTKNFIALQRFNHRYLGSDPNLFIDAICKNPKINPKNVFDWCYNPYYTYEHVLKLIARHIDLDCNSVSQESADSGARIYNLLLKQAKVEFKDFYLPDTPASMYSSILKLFYHPLPEKQEQRIKLLCQINQNPLNKRKIFELIYPLILEDLERPFKSPAGILSDKFLKRIDELSRQSSMTFENLLVEAVRLYDVHE